ncbi:MAG TPA: PQQ-dependent sugar dehydrogenase [Candidatus Kapabacteria bacterium]|nr:PQQ-dependent sugar dehydrogenase [Candidatus Kapabacteria bacterium]
MRTVASIVLAAILGAACSRAQTFGTAPAFPNLHFNGPIGLYSVPGSSTLYVVEQGGRIRAFNNDPATATSRTFLDISDSITSGGETGLLGLAFDPNYNNNGYFYLDYTRTVNGQLQTVISRMSRSLIDSLHADRNTEKILLVIDQPYANHNGGQIVFGPDGYLYIAMGDGGSGGDPQGNGQNRTKLLGKILRIDVHGTSPGLEYGIPPTNPFAGNSSGYRQEIYTWGMRNTWRFSFDPVTGWLWAGDVGQDRWEEIDILEAGRNYGWNITEGFHCYNASTCDTTGLTQPIWEYPHDNTGGQSITGGFVYRGPSLPSLVGKYIYADYVKGKIWALTYQPGQPATNTLLRATSYLITSFGVDSQNELYFCASDGNIYKLIQTSGVDAASRQDRTALIQIAPNPSGTATLIDYTLAADGPVLITLHDATGRLVRTLVDGQQSAGEHGVMLDATTLPSATYFCRLAAAGSVSTRPVVLTR